MSAANTATALPASVGRSPRPRRSRSGTPNDRSSARTWTLTVGCVTPSARAAAVTEPSRATASKYRRWS